MAVVINSKKLKECRVGDKNVSEIYFSDGVTAQLLWGGYGGNTISVLQNVNAFWATGFTINVSNGVLVHVDYSATTINLRGARLVNNNMVFGSTYAFTINNNSSYGTFANILHWENNIFAVSYLDKALSGVNYLNYLDMFAIDGDTLEISCLNKKVSMDVNCSVQYLVRAGNSIITSTLGGYTPKWSQIVVDGDYNLSPKYTSSPIDNNFQYNTSQYIQGNANFVQPFYIDGNYVYAFYRNYYRTINSSQAEFERRPIILNKKNVLDKPLSYSQFPNNASTKYTLVGTYQKTIAYNNCLVTMHEHPYSNLDTDFKKFLSMTLSKLENDRVIVKKTITIEELPSYSANIKNADILWLNEKKIIIIYSNTSDDILKIRIVDVDVDKETLIANTAHILDTRAPENKTNSSLCAIDKRKFLLAHEHYTSSGLATSVYTKLLTI